MLKSEKLSLPPNDVSYLTFSVESTMRTEKKERKGPKTKKKTWQPTVKGLELGNRAE